MVIQIKVLREVVGVNNNRLFFYNKPNYYLKLKPEIERYFKPKSILLFGIVLPFYLPLKNNTNLTYKVNQNTLCHYRFHLVNHKEKFYSGSYNEIPVETNVQRTRVEMVYIPRNNMIISDELLSKSFNLLLEKLNELIKSIIIITKNKFISKVNGETLEPMVLYSLIDLTEYDVMNQGLFHLNYHKLENGGKPLSTKETDLVMCAIDLLPNNPFTFSTELYLSAIRSLHIGDLRKSVIDSQTAVETFLTALYRYLVLKEGYSQEEVDKKVNDIAFKNLVIHQFHKRLGGDFDIRDEGTPISDWWSNTYLLRNKIVHEGKLPSHSEAIKSIDSVNELFKYVTDLIHLSHNQEAYPELTSLILKPVEG